MFSSLKLLHLLNLNCASTIGRSFTNFVFFYVDRNFKMTTTVGHSFYIGPIGSFYDQVNDTGSWEPLVYFATTLTLILLKYLFNLATTLTLILLKYLFDLATTLTLILLKYLFNLATTLTLILLKYLFDLATTLTLILLKYLFNLATTLTLILLKYLFNLATTLTLIILGCTYYIIILTFTLLEQTVSM